MEAVPFSTIGEGVREAVKEAAERGIPLLCVGSLYLYRSILDQLQTLP